MGTDSASIMYHAKRVKGPLITQKEQRGFEHEKFQVVMEDHEMGNAIRCMKLSEFYPSKEMQGNLLNLLWDCRHIFKGLGKLYKYSAEYP